MKVDTSIDSLSPKFADLSGDAFRAASAWVKYHNIIGVVPPQWWLSTIAKESDGVVTKESAPLGLRFIRNRRARRSHHGPRPSAGRAGSAADSFGTSGRTARPAKRPRGQIAAIVEA